jgi:hypothetical protein
MSRASFVTIGIAAALAVCCLAALLAIVRIWDTSAGAVSPDEISRVWAGLAAACMIAAVGTYAVCWFLLMRALERRPVALAAALQLFLVSWPGRYVPGSLPHYGGRLLAGPRIGLSRPAIAASLAYENLFAVATSGILAVALLLARFRGGLAQSNWAIAAACVALLCACALHPSVARRAARLVASRVNRLRAVETHLLGARAVVAIGTAYTFAALCAGLSFYCGLRAVAPHDQPPLLLAIASYNLAGIAGVLAIFVPSGIGVREGVVVAMIGAAVSAPVALGAAVLVRLIAVVVDVLPMALIVATHAIRRTLAGRREPVASPIDARQARVP